MRAKLSSEPRARRKKMTFHLLSLFHFFCHYFSFFSRSNKAVSCVQLRIRTSLLIHRLSRTTADFMFLEMRPAPHQTRTPSQPMRRLKDTFDSMRGALENTKCKACNIEFAVFMAGKAVVHSNAFRLVSTRRSKSLADIDDCKHAAFFSSHGGCASVRCMRTPFPREIRQSAQAPDAHGPRRWARWRSPAFAVVSVHECRFFFKNLMLYDNYSHRYDWHIKQDPINFGCAICSCFMFMFYNVTTL